MGSAAVKFYFAVEILTSVKSLQKNVFIYDILFIFYFYDTYFRNVRTLLCFSVCIQLVPKKQCDCVFVRGGGVREVLAPSACPQLNTWELWLSMCGCADT